MTIQLSPFPDGYVLNPQQGGTGVDATQIAAGQILVTSGNPQIPFTVTPVPAAPARVPAEFILLQEQYPSGTSAAVGIIGQNTRYLNTVVFNNIPGADVSSIFIAILPPGTYRFTAFGYNGSAAPGQLSIRDSTSSAVLMHGGSLAEPVLDVPVTFAVTTGIYMRQFMSTTDSLGSPAGSGSVEVYSQLLIEKV